MTITTLIIIIATCAMAFGAFICKQLSPEKKHPLQDNIGLAVVVLGILSVMAAVIANSAPMILIIRLLGGAWMVLFGLFIGFERISKMLKMDNPVFMEELQSTMQKLTDKKDTVAIISFIFAALLAYTAYNDITLHMQLSGARESIIAQ